MGGIASLGRRGEAEPEAAGGGGGGIGGGGSAGRMGFPSFTSDGAGTGSGSSARDSSRCAACAAAAAETVSVWGWPFSGPTWVNPGISFSASCLTSVLTRVGDRLRLFVRLLLLPEGPPADAS